jgi:hypothetical protein
MTHRPKDEPLFPVVIDIILLVAAIAFVLTIMGRMG